MPALSSGKLVNMLRLVDAGGRFKMLAVDQRDSLRHTLGRAIGRQPAEITYEDLATTKALITEVLSPVSTATLVDPVYGFPRAVTLVPADTGILVAAEETGYERAGTSGRERKSRLIDGWSVAKAKRAGANAVKLLIYYNPEASDEVRTHQQRLVRRVGEDCLRADIPFLLECVTYPIEEPAADTAEFARRRPQHTVESAREFSRDDYHVDILKLEFPGDLKYARQFHGGALDGKERPAIYDVDDLRDFCRQVNEAARRPWVILSGGVDIAEFLVDLELAIDAGASGFLCGRAIWKDAVPKYPDVAAMRAFLTTEGRSNFARANTIAERAHPWFSHAPFEGHAPVPLALGDEEWYRRYGESVVQHASGRRP